jgi:hypothetical protein
MGGCIMNLAARDIHSSSAMDRYRFGGVGMEIDRPYHAYMHAAFSC